jgi:hypothetical protein
MKVEKASFIQPTRDRARGRPFTKYPVTAQSLFFLTTYPSFHMFASTWNTTLGSVPNGRRLLSPNAQFVAGKPHVERDGGQTGDAPNT